ncbi:hypothetical protein [Variovorax saccharolyticus]|uniref:hypothetical protein n=1 Tax=Variovorax saccharolyticus TaxID=3053516 RepID=UPI002578167E|nr:hypothetical protein [Variovorax sp. J31P216]MDM0029836.1 hypothetical protein [Variovorax sp. J31P216]
MPLVRLRAEVPIFSIADEFLVRAVPLSEWANLDAAAELHGTGYEGTAPVFVTASFVEEKIDRSLEETYEMAWRAFEQSSYVFYLCLLLASAARIPEPELSIAYYRDPAALVPISRVGPFGYEALAYVRNEHPIEVDALTLQRAEKLLLALQESAGPLLNVPEVERARDVLYGFAYPEYEPITDFLHCVAAVENLLVPEPVQGIQATLRRRAVALLGPKLGKRADEFIAAVYELRSRLAHGDDTFAARERLARLWPGVDPAAPWHLGRSLLCVVLSTLIEAARGAVLAGASAATIATALDRGDGACVFAKLTP